MSKIIKHTFKIPHLIVKDGELVQDKETEVTYQFTLLFKGIGLYEEITGKSLLNSLLSSVKFDELEENKVDEMTSLDNLVDKQLIKDLASASYVKIVGDKFHNNRATVEEFRKSIVYPVIENDFEFVMKLITMAMDCVYDEQKGKAKTKQEVNRPKK